MTLTRRALLAALAALGATLVGRRAGAAPRGATPPAPSTHTTMYGLIGKMTTQPGQRDALAAILLEGTSGMPGCRSYVVAADATDPDALWITEVWDSQADHQASLQLPAVRAAIAKGRPLIAGFSNRVETTPIGGAGL